MKKILFTKMSGAGNDFILIDSNKNPGLDINTNLIKTLCDRRNGIGADGVITVSDSNKYNFEMNYFNADGTSSLCGNGARCAIKFAESTGRINGSTINFISNGGKYSGEILNENEVKFNLNSPKLIKKNFKIKASDQLINASYVDTGSPHVVIKIEDVLENPLILQSGFKNIDDFPVYNLGREIRYHKDFQPPGTNVNFIQLKKDKIFIRTYERGVENETLACGTGSAASALISVLSYGYNPPVTLVTRGGDELFVDFFVEENEIKNFSLTGPAVLVFTGEIIIN